MNTIDDRKTRAVIFDMDGVLVDSYRAHYESWKKLGEQHCLEMTEQQFAATFGRTSRDIIHNLWGDAVAEEDIPAWDEQKEAFYRDILRQDFPAMDGATELLRALHESGFAIAIGSSGPPENIAVVCEMLDGAELIEAQVTGQDVTRGKPDPQVFLIAAERLGVEPVRCAVVEDAPAGVEAARRAKMASIALTGTAEADELAKNAHLVVDSLTELSPDTIGRLIDSHTA
jgi:beta-phosphoglucomutase